MPLFEIRYSVAFLFLAVCLFQQSSVLAQFQVGASAVDISPRQLPAIRNGGFLEASSSKVDAPLYARAVVLSDGSETIAISIVDSCMFPTDVCDAIKNEVTLRIGIPANRILISATHTHSAPSTMDLCLGTSRDENYTPFVILKVADGIVEAHGKLRPAKIGHAAVDAWEFTNCRRWITRSDRMGTDPFGDRSVRAMMHPGYQNPNYIGPTGPIDPQLSVVSVVSAADDSPICVMANYSMHYFGAGGGFSPDYFGEVAKLLEKEIGGDQPMVGIMSQGTSGDLHWMDYSQPRRAGFGRADYARGLASLVVRASKKIGHTSSVTLAMAEKRVRLKRRTASADRLAWAKEINDSRGDRRPHNRPEVYAEQAAWIHEHPDTEVVLQAVRIGDIGITAIPNEVYGSTGLRLKAYSPLESTFNLELANGAEGYIPPPEQHALGGYTTWPARTAGLEKDAEPVIVETLLGLLEKVSGRKRRAVRIADGPYAKALLAAKPVAYFHCDEMMGQLAIDRVAQRNAKLEDGIALRLPGVRRNGGDVSAPPDPDSPFTGTETNRAWHIAGGRFRADTLKLGKSYSVSLWFWNGMLHDAKPVTGYLFSLGRDGDMQAAGEHLGIGGNHHDVNAGVLFLYTGDRNGKVVAGKTQLAIRDWHHVTLVRDHERLTVYLDGKPEIETEIDWTIEDRDSLSIFLGGRCDNRFGLEGKLDEIALFDRTLTAAEVNEHFLVSERVPPTPEPDVPPLSINESLKRIHVPDGYEVELVAAEPLIADPVAFDWDPKGRLWVVEMADYPLGMDGKGKAGGRVRVLEDSDNDGKYDKSVVFADQLNFPNGLITWRDGVIVTAAPDILFLKDSDGDRRADVREVLYTGLQQGNQQLRANGLRWGLDNWIHVAGGGHHGKYGLNTRVHSTRANIDVVIGSRDFRIRPDTGAVEPQSGPTQFGGNRDDWGRWFGTQNSHPIWHYVLPDQYLKRNPHYVAGEVRQQLFPTNPPVYPASRLQKRYHNFQQAGRFTSACSGMIYRDRHLFEGDGVHAFVCEPFQNLVQQSKLQPNGVTFAAHRVGDVNETDFFASEDRWCRPVMARTGPDGALWIADMHRYMIEHPQWLPDAGKTELLPHYRLGDDRGRIYRVKKPGPIAAATDLGTLPLDALIELLESDNGWVRDQVHQMLVWKNTASSNEDLRACVPKLRQLIAESQSPLARLHALCILEAHQSLTAQEIAIGLSDLHPGVRENSLRLAQSLPFKEVAPFLPNLVNDLSPRVRLQLAFALGSWSDRRAGEWLADTLMKDGDDPWVAAAVFSSSLPHLTVLAERVAEARGDQSVRIQQLMQIALGANDRGAIAALLDVPLGDPSRQLSEAQLRLLTLFLDGLKSNKTTLEALSRKSDRLTKLLNGLGGVLDRASEDSQESAEQSWGVSAASLLIRSPDHREAGIAMLEGQLAQATSRPHFQQVLDAFRGCDDERVPPILFDLWSVWTPEFRSRGIDVLLSRRSWTVALLDEIKANRIGAGDIDPTRRTQLLQHRDKRIKQSAKELFKLNSTKRSQVVEQFRPVLQMIGNADAGLVAYKRVCASCHKHGNIGRLVGPDLKTVVEHTPDKILTNILDPNLDIQPGYQAYACLLASGELLYGLIKSENATGIVLTLVDGRTRTIARDEVEMIKNTGVSLMPENLETTMTQQEIADIIAFLRRRN